MVCSFGHRRTRWEIPRQNRIGEERFEVAHRSPAPVNPGTTMHQHWLGQVFIELDQGTPILARKHGSPICRHGNGSRLQPELFIPAKQASGEMAYRSSSSWLSRQMTERIPWARTVLTHRSTAGPRLAAPESLPGREARPRPSAGSQSRMGPLVPAIEVGVAWTPGWRRPGTSLLFVDFFILLFLSWWL
jgi:hypothetical protein